MDPGAVGKGRRALIVVAVFSFVGALASFGLLPCPTALLFRFPCPGCGLTRATLALAHGHLAEALRFHPLVLLALPGFAALFGSNAIVYIHTGRWGWAERQMGRGFTWVSGVIVVLLFALWFSRFFGAFGGPVPV
jgi:hypothetical protein